MQKMNELFGKRVISPPTGEQIATVREVVLDPEARQIAMDLLQEYNVGDRVQLTEPCAGGYVGEPARVLRVKRDAQGNVISLDILLDACNETTRGTTVYLREVEPAPDPSA